jgi:hypothetical protein
MLIVKGHAGGPAAVPDTPSHRRQQARGNIQWRCARPSECPGHEPVLRLGASAASFGRPLEIDRQIEKDETALLDIHHQGGPLVDAVVHLAGDRAPEVTFARMLRGLEVPIPVVP